MIRVSADIHDADNNTDTCSDLNNVYKWEIGAIGTALDFYKESSIFEVETKPNTNRKWKLKMHFKSTSDKVQLQILSCNDGIIPVTFEFLVLSEDYNNTPSRFSRNSQASQDQEPVQLLCKGGNHKFSYGSKHSFSFHKSLLTGRGKLFVQCSIDEMLPDWETESKLIADYSELFMSSDYSDFVLKVGGKTFNVHRNILGVRSKVFKAMFSSMLEETKRGYVDIEDTDADKVEEMLGYIYAGRLPASGMKSAERLLIAADKYDLEELREICEYQSSIEITERNACEKLMLADMYKCSTLKREVLDFIRRHINGIIITDGYKEMSSNPSHVGILNDIVCELSKFASIKPTKVNQTSSIDTC